MVIGEYELTAKDEIECIITLKNNALTNKWLNGKLIINNTTKNTRTVFYYENNTQDRKLEETLKLVKMIGVEIVGDHEKDDEVKIEINPGEQRLVQLKAIKPNWSVQSNVSYFIREAFT